MLTSFISHPVVAMLLMLGALVLFHEAGHFIVGRLCGVAVETFSIGFGGNIVSKKVGETTYQISWLPLGGFVKFYGASRNEDSPEHLNGRLFFQAPIWKRSLIIGAGPFANFLLAFLIFWIAIMNGLEMPPPQVGDIIEGSRAQLAGIQPRDRFVKIDNQDVTAWDDIERLISKNPEHKLNVVLDRQGKQVELTLVPEAVTGLSLFGAKAQIGRAGIALGFPSAVITVTDLKSIAGSIGLSTGDQIESFKTENGSWTKIEGFHNLLQLLKQWKVSNASKITLKASKVHVAEDEAHQLKEVSDGVSREIEINPSKWPAIDSMSDRSYAAALGVFDSHLTLGLIRGPAKELLKSGDRITKWDNKEVKTIFHLQELMGENLTENINIQVLRDQKLLDIKTPLKPLELQKPEGLVKIFVLDAAMLGLSVMPQPLILKENNPFKAATLAVHEGAKKTSLMLASFWAIAKGTLPLKALGGPILIAKVASDSARAGFLAFFGTMAVISINLALVNLFPIPVLDGGQLVMLASEKIKGSPLKERTVENFHKLGFVLVLCLIVLAMYNDLSRFWASMIGSISGAPK